MLQLGISSPSHKCEAHASPGNAEVNRRYTILLPECHNIKSLLLKCFVVLRLRIWAKDQQAALVTEKKKSGGEMGSRSMAMRLAVKGQVRNLMVGISVMRGSIHTYINF